MKCSLWTNIWNNLQEEMSEEQNKVKTESIVRHHLITKKKGYALSKGTQDTENRVPPWRVSQWLRARRKGKLTFHYTFFLSGIPLACITLKTIKIWYAFFYLTHVSSQILNKYVLSIYSSKEEVIFVRILVLFQGQTG